MRMEEFVVNNSEEFENMVENGDIKIAKALVETVLKNLKGYEKCAEIVNALKFLKDK